MRNEPKAAVRVLVATGDVSYGATAARFLETEGYRLDRCHDARGVLRIVSRNDFDVIVLDLALCCEGDIELVSFVRRQTPEAQVILLFDVANIERAIEGIRHGAFFYLPGSSPPSDIALVVGKAVRNKRARKAMGKYEQDLFEETVGAAPAMKRVIEMIAKVAPTDSTTASNCSRKNCTNACRPWASS